MRHILFATVAVVGLAAAIPVFAEGQNQRQESANSLPKGFYDNTEEQLHAQIKQNHFAAQQTKPVVQGTNAGGLSHVDVLSYMLGRPARTAG